MTPELIRTCIERVRGMEDTDEDALATARRLAGEAGIIGGISANPNV